MKYIIYLLTCMITSYTTARLLIDSLNELIILIITILLAIFIIHPLFYLHGNIYTILKKTENREKVYYFKKSYLQLNINQCGLGINIYKDGIDIVILIFYIGWHKRFTV